MSGDARDARPDAAVPEPALRELEYVVVDVETTGGSHARGHRVTEVAALRVAGCGTVLEEFHTLINPERSIPRFITALTNITDDMVRGAPRFAEVLPELRRMLDGRVFVAHNASFDRNFLRAEIDWATAEAFEPRTLCTVRLARRVVPEVSSRALDSLSDYFGIENDARHRAYGDARVTAVLLHRLLERLDEREITTWAGLEALLGASKKRRRRRSSPESMEWT